MAHPALEGAHDALTPSVAAVGGVVRDALLGRPTGPDVDLLVEGDPAPVARAIAAATGADLELHPRFLAASVVRGGDRRIDLVGARTETYPNPGALPEVAPATLERDLARRDFTVNAIAMRLVGPEAGALADPHGGGADLAAGVLRLMRPDGFEEDPSRLVRAARYVCRLGIGPSPETEAAARAAAPRLDPGSARVVDELQRLLGEEDLAAPSALLARWGVPWLRSDEASVRASLASLADACATPGVPAIPPAGLRLAAVVRPGRLGELALPGPLARVAAAAARGTECARALGEAARPSETTAILDRVPDATAIAALAAGAESVREYWGRYRDVRPEITGDDLRAAGIPPGEAIGRALAAVRAEALDRGLAGREAQLALALRVAAGEEGRA